MFCNLIISLCVAQMALAAPQFVTFKDGKVGVNFAGYHAEAGLGGLLTGNAAHGGLSASAGTPWGPKAAAGINGGVDGRAFGTAYAGAQLNPEVGASSIIGGSTGDHQSGFSGAEAHSNGKAVLKTHGVLAGEGGVAGEAGGAVAEHEIQKVHTKSVQKIKPHKKYHLIKTEEILHSNVNVNRKPSGNFNDAKIPTVDSNQNEAAVTQLNSSDFSRTTTTVAASSADHDNNKSNNVAEVISVKRGRHRERKQRRRLAQPKQRTHNVQRTKGIIIRNAVEPASATLLTTASSVAAAAGVEESKSGAAAAHSKQLVKTVYKEIRLPSGSTLVSQDSLAAAPQHAQHPYSQLHSAPSVGYESQSVGVHANGGLVGSVLNIPIGILKSLQESLSGIDVNKSVSYTKLT